MTLRILHLVGSAESEFLGELSRLYAQDCLLSTADPERYEFRIAYVTPDARWRFPTGLNQAALDAAPAMDLATAMRHPALTHLDLVVPQMFCVPGMTTYRALFDALGIPYVGNSPGTMFLGADKAKARAVVAAAGVPVPPAEVLRRGERPTLIPPVVVKPVNSDNSFGLTKVDDRSGYADALTLAFAHSPEVLVESYVELGREVRCGIIVRDGTLDCLPLEEYDVDRVTKPIRNHDDKIGRSADGTLKLLAKDASRAWIVDRADPLTQRVWELARRAHEALGCRDYSLFDFRVDPSGQPWFLEAGLYCSFARDSVLCAMARAAGITLSELFDSALTEALARRPLQVPTEISFLS